MRLFTTLVRFDAVYNPHFKCNRSTLTALPALWGYARDLFQTPGFGETVDFEQIKRHYYVVQRDINPTGVVPNGPDVAVWRTRHGREDLGGGPTETRPKRQVKSTSRSMAGRARIRDHGPKAWGVDAVTNDRGRR